MCERRIELLKQYFKIEKEQKEADAKGLWHVARARKYRMGRIQKELEMIKQNELREEQSSGDE